MSSQLDWHWLLARPSLQICKTTTLHTHTLTHVPLVLTFNWKFCAVFAEASCAAAVRAAQDIVADIGVEAASRSGGLLELSRKRPKNGERDCQHLMAKKLRLSLPIAQHYLDTKDDSLKLPFLRFRDWLSFLLKHNCLHILCGLVKHNPDRQGDIFEAFWRRFAIHHPDHPVIQRAERGEISLRRTVPLLLHGDEGRSKKRSPFLVCNLHSPLGRGVEAGLQEGRRREYLKMLPNFTGHSYTNRFLVSCLPKQDYCGKNSFVFDILMQTIAEELHHCASEGVQHEGQRYLAVCIGIVGDWPWLCKAGGLQRSFMNVNKHKEDAGGRRRSECRGVCHLCRAGATWLALWTNRVKNATLGGNNADTVSVSGAMLPWNHSALPWKISRYVQVWRFPHVAFGSGQKLFGRNVGSAEWTRRWFQCWCSLWTAECAIQGMVSSKWEDSLLPTHHQGALELDKQESLPHWKLAQRRPHHYFDALGWIPVPCRAVARWDAGVGRAGCCGNQQGRTVDVHFWRLDGASYGPGMCRLGFALFEKIQQPGFAGTCSEQKIVAGDAEGTRITPSFLHLLQQSNVGRCFNLICTSVQQDEDFIGRNSRLSRHVSTLTCAQRVMERHLQACYAQYVEAGYLVSVGSSWYIFCSTWPSPHLKIWWI